MSDKATNPRSETTNPEPFDREDGHIAALGELCDCHACLVLREVERAVHSSTPRTRDPATVTDIDLARQRAMPTLPTFLGQFRGKVPQLTWRDRVERWLPADRKARVVLGLVLGYAVFVAIAWAVKS